MASSSAPAVSGDVLPVRRLTNKELNEIRMDMYDKQAKRAEWKRAQEAIADRDEATGVNMTTEVGKSSKETAEERIEKEVSKTSKLRNLLETLRGVQAELTDMDAGTEEEGEDAANELTKEIMEVA